MSFGDLDPLLPPAPYFFYALLDGAAVTAIVEQQVPPSGAVDVDYAALPGYAGVPEAPGPGRQLQVTAGALVWVDVRDLESARADKHVSARLAFTKTPLGTFTWSSSTFDADTESQLRLQRLRVALLAGEYVDTAVRRSNGTWLTLTSSDLAGVWTALLAHLQGVDDGLAAKDLAIAAAATLGELDDVDT